MILRMAPLEGLTSRTYRQVFQKYYEGVDVFYTPFVTATHTHSFQGRERKEFSPFQDNVIPQVMTKDASVFIPAALQMAKEGYREVNINMGCPAPTAFTKGRGSGMLKSPETLNLFFEEVFSVLENRETALTFMDALKESDPYITNVWPVLEALRNEDSQLQIPKISVKMRPGVTDHKEMEVLARVIEKYPVSQVILHPRVREEYYAGEPNKESFRILKEIVSCPVCYNGDLFSPDDVISLREEFPDQDDIMIGRGILADPTLPMQIKEGKTVSVTEGEEKEKLFAFLNDLKESYRQVLSGDRDVLFKMVDLWFYVGRNFPGEEKTLKKLRRSKNMTEYDSAVKALFEA